MMNRTELLYSLIKSIHLISKNGSDIHSDFPFLLTNKDQRHALLHQVSDELRMYFLMTGAKYSDGLNFEMIQNSVPKILITKENDCNVLNENDEELSVELIICFKIFDIRELLAELSWSSKQIPKATKLQEIVFDVDYYLLDILRRLVQLCNKSDINRGHRLYLSKLILKEIIVYLLNNNNSNDFIQIVNSFTFNQKISNALKIINDKVAQKIDMVELASTVHMSPSSFRKHFLSVVGDSPLQYQKKIRLKKAKLLLLNQNIDIKKVAILIGYESQSQFTREYKRLFGISPRKERKIRSFLELSISRAEQVISIQNLFTLEDELALRDNSTFVHSLGTELIEYFNTNLYVVRENSVDRTDADREKLNESLFSWWQITVKGPFNSKYWVWQALWWHLHEKIGVSDKQVQHILNLMMTRITEKVIEKQISQNVSRAIMKIFTLISVFSTENLVISQLDVSLNEFAISEKILLNYMASNSIVKLLS